MKKHDEHNGHDHSHDDAKNRSGEAHGDHDEAGPEHKHEEGDDHSGHDHSHEYRTIETASLVLSGFFVLGALLSNWKHLFDGRAAMVTSILAMLTGGWFLLPKAWGAIIKLRPDINLLVVIAAIGASVVGEWVEAAAVVFLFGVAEWLEGWAERRAQRAVEALLEIAPKVAYVLRDGKAVEVPVAEVKVDETVTVHSGMSIPLDGVVTTGESGVNQAPITGESVPVDKKPGDTVFAGTINGEGSLAVRVTKMAGDTTLAKIIRLVKEAQEQKAPTQRFVDAFARYYTPIVTVVALLIFLVPPLAFGGVWSEWLYRACVLLIIACPCALVISTPVSIVAALAAMAKLGVLVKGGAHLESIARLKALALDKTGTITEGKPRVLGVEVVSATADETAILKVAAAIDSHSAHPLAKAIVDHVQKRGIPFNRATNYQNRSGRGAEAVVEGHPHFVGNHRFAHELGVCSPEIEARLSKIEERGQSVVVVGHMRHDNCGGEVLGVIAVGDAVRPQAAAAIKALHAAGVEKIVMLSGDNQRTATYIAKQVGIDEAKGDLLPDDKVGAIKALREQYAVVGMVGDGVNDAPAMATASIGIAMGAAGTDAAIETADVALMQDDLGKIADTILLGKRTLRIIKFNISFALTLKAVFLILTLMGYASLWLAIMADTGATLLVVANALRLLRVDAARRPSPSGDQHDKNPKTDKT
jgi:Cd2+/Zn2+-exporting ATPase